MWQVIERGEGEHLYWAVMEEIDGISKRASCLYAKDGCIRKDAETLAAALNEREQPRFFTQHCKFFPQHCNSFCWVVKDRLTPSWCCHYSHKHPFGGQAAAEAEAARLNKLDRANKQG